MGNTCKPMAVSFQCMTKFTAKKKKKKRSDLSSRVSLAPLLRHLFFFLPSTKDSVIQ